MVSEFFKKLEANLSDVLKSAQRRQSETLE